MYKSNETIIEEEARKHGMVIGYDEQKIESFKAGAKFAADFFLRIVEETPYAAMCKMGDLDYFDKLSIKDIRSAVRAMLKHEETREGV